MGIATVGLMTDNEGDTIVELDPIKKSEKKRKILTFILHFFVVLLIHL